MSQASVINQLEPLVSDYTALLIPYGQAVMTNRKYKTALNAFPLEEKTTVVPEMTITSHRFFWTGGVPG